MIELDNKKDKIAVIASNQNLLDLLEESFLLYGKFSISIFANNLILDLIKKVDNISVLIISIDILDDIDKKHLNFFRENEKKSIFLINNKHEKNILLEKQIKPKSIINIPLSLSNIIPIIDSIIREETNKMNDIIIGNFSLDVVGRKISFLSSLLIKKIDFFSFSLKKFKYFLSRLSRISMETSKTLVLSTFFIKSKIELFVKIDIENFPYNKNDSSNKSSKFWLFAIIAILSFWLSNPISHYSLAYPYMGRTK